MVHFESSARICISLKKDMETSNKKKVIPTKRILLG